MTPTEPWVIPGRDRRDFGGVDRKAHADVKTVGRLVNTFLDSKNQQVTDRDLTQTTFNAYLFMGLPLGGDGSPTDISARLG